MGDTKKKETKTTTNDNVILPDISNIKTQDTYTLPSKGLIYTVKENIPASITLRRMTTAEDKIRLRNMSQDKIRRDILQACVVDKDVDVSKLKLSDATYLLFKLRSLSLLTDEYKVQCFCPGCTTQFVHELNLLDIPVKYFKKEDMKLLTLTLPLSKQVVVFKYPSIGSTILMSDKIAERTENFPDLDKNELIYTAAIIVYIDTVGGQSMMSEEIEYWLDNLDILDSRAIRTRIEELDNVFGMDQIIPTVCPNCGREITHALPITRELFTPSL